MVFGAGVIYCLAFYRKYVPTPDLVHNELPRYGLWFSLSAHVPPNNVAYLFFLKLEKSAV